MSCGMIILKVDREHNSNLDASKPKVNDAVVIDATCVEIRNLAGKSDTLWSEQDIFLATLFKYSIFNHCTW